uniref:50S ribosomal protein L32, chloroplastic n=1 Tax=Coccolithus braarudii TaxID=221442 RepID=A0A7S0PW60_9EUKA|mmetsp:Transcript_18798/g.40518  ORF Transcript_18798/g.40518 Transcript_18798/m.40518 type:complete len:118 (+) Transcript_18798:61-414(+)
MAARTLLLLAFAALASAFTAPTLHTQMVRSSPQRAADGLASSRPACVRVADVVMAVPKKRQSKMKTRQRKANWFAKAKRQAQLAMSRAKSAGYKPLEDPKFVTMDDDDDDDDDDDKE